MAGGRLACVYAVRDRAGRLAARPIAISPADGPIEMFAISLLFGEPGLAFVGLAFLLGSGWNHNETMPDCDSSCPMDAPGKWQTMAGCWDRRRDEGQGL